MKVLPVSSMCYCGKSSNMKSTQNVKPQNPVALMSSKLNFKRGGAASTAAILGTIYGGTALFFAAPVAVIAGAALIGALSGAALADDKPIGKPIDHYNYYA